MSKEGWIIVLLEFTFVILFAAICVYGENQQRILRSDYGCK